MPSKQSTDPFDQLGESEVYRCDNPDYPEVWFYDINEAGEIERYHSAFGFDCDAVDTSPTPKQALNALHSDNVDVEVVDVEVLEEHRARIE